jgi:PatG C-terminal
VDPASSEPPALTAGWSSLDAGSVGVNETERDMEETDATSGVERSPLEGDNQPLPVAGRPAPPSPSFVYALGQIGPRFPSLAVEKEFAQVTGRADAAGLTDREALQAALSDRANRYLVRQLCWVFVIEGLETYLLAPRDPADLDLLVEATRPRPNPTDLDVVIGVLGPLAPPEACNGLVVPVVVFDQLYSFDRDALLGAIPRPKGVPAKEDERFRATAAELLDRILQMADNAGATDEHRALNYLAVRYPAIYAQTAEAHAGNASLAAVDVRSSRLSGVRRIIDVIFSYTNRQTDVTEKYFVRVDVTEEFPFLVTKLSPYYER